MAPTASAMHTRTFLLLRLQVGSPLAGWACAYPTSASMGTGGNSSTRVAWTTSTTDSFLSDTAAGLEALSSTPMPLTATAPGLTTLSIWPIAPSPPSLPAACCTSALLRTVGLASVGFAVSSIATDPSSSWPESSLAPGPFRWSSASAAFSLRWW